MIKDKIQEALNKQVNWELYSSYLYLSMAAYFASAHLKGFANWMRAQVQEEIVHAIKFYDYLIERGGTVTLSSIESPPTQWTSHLSAFEQVYTHEQKVTKLIHELVGLAASEQDYATSVFLQWFVKEQVEEESSAHTVLQQLRRIGGGGEGLYILDHELAKRVFIPAGAPKP